MKLKIPNYCYFPLLYFPLLFEQKKYNKCPNDRGKQLKLGKKLRNILAKNFSGDVWNVQCVYSRPDQVDYKRVA